MALASSFGQTYFIGVFGPSIQADFGLGHTAWGAVYLVGTLASAALLPWSGKLLDRVSLRAYAIAVAVLLAISAAAMSLVAGVITLAAAIFLLRQTGQGLSSHVAITSMARYFERDRGRAIAVAALGFSAGEAILPVAAVAAIAAFGWRATYAGIAVVVVAVLVPIVALCLRRAPEIEVRELGDGEIRARSWTRAEVLADVRFYLITPGVVCPSLVITALFFHHLNLAEAKGWSDAWITGNYVVFAGTGTAVALLAGRLIDRVGAIRLLPMMLAPMIAALLLVSAVDHRLIVWLYLGLLGVAVGVAHTAVTAMWAELYGVDHLGAIRAMVTAVAVFASALGPVALGALMDSGLSIERSLWAFAAYTAVAAALMTAGLRRRPTDS
jgi:MFS family permease